MLPVAGLRATAQVSAVRREATQVPGDAVAAEYATTAQVPSGATQVLGAVVDAEEARRAQASPGKRGEAGISGVTASKPLNAH